VRLTWVLFGRNGQYGADGRRRAAARKVLAARRVALGSELGPELGLADVRHVHAADPTTLLLQVSMLIVVCIAEENVIVPRQIYTCLRRHLFVIEVLVVSLFEWLLKSSSFPIFPTKKFQIYGLFRFFKCTHAFF